MNLKKFKLKVAEIDKIIPQNKWIEIPVENNYWRFFEYQGLYAFYNKKEIVYIGISSDINSRLKSHTSYNGKFKGEENISKIKIKISSLDWPLLEHIEKRLILRLKPKCNKFIVSKNILEINKRNLLVKKHDKDIRQIKQTLGIK